LRKAHPELDAVLPLFERNLGDRIVLEIDGAWYAISRSPAA